MIILCILRGNVILFQPFIKPLRNMSGIDIVNLFVMNIFKNISNLYLEYKSWDYLEQKFIIEM